MLCAAFNAGAQGGGDADARIARIVADLPDALVTQHSTPTSLQQRMKEAGVPAVSVAVFQDGRLAWARAWGLRDTETGGAVDTRTVFQAASISKPVAALGAVMLASTGRLDLDADIGTAVPGWQAGAAVTPRQLLSHTAGLGVPGFPGYAAGQPVPSVAQVLAGAPPARTPAVQVDGPVGRQARYSGGGYVVLQALLAARSGQPFDGWMQSTVFGPLGMGDSSFQQPWPAETAARAASGHRQGQRLPGRWHTYPELAAAGLWTTPTDLGRLAAALQDQLAGRPSALQPAGLASRMLTPQAGGFGLGWVLDTRAGEPVFGHTGLNEGFEALLAASASPRSPQHLVVVMTNGQGGTALAQALLRAIARDVGWAAHAPRQVVAQALPAAELLALEGFYTGAGRSLAIEVSDGVAQLRDGGWQRARLVPLSAQRFAVENRPFDLVFGTPAADGGRSLTLQGGDTPTLLQAQPRPLAGGSPPLLRGSVNQWGTADAFLPTGDGEWQLTLPLAPGEVQFKVAAADWNLLNLGARLSAPPLAIGQPQRLAPAGDNLRLVVERGGRHRFILSAADPARPQLRVERVD